MQHGADFDFSVFLGDVNLHVPYAYSHREDLRARVLHHAVLAEPLIVADSHSLNSPMLRSLFAREDGARFAGHDLGELLRRGDLRVSRRDALGAEKVPVTSFRQIQDDHLARGVTDVPPPAYGDWLDEVTEGRVIEFVAEVVAGNFKRGFLARLDRRLADATSSTPRDYLHVLHEFRGWADDQQLLLYRAIRDKKEALEKTAGRESMEALEFVERSASGSYHLAVPTSIATAVSGPRSDELVELPPSIRPTGSTTLPTSIINPTVWQHVPVDAVIEILELPSRQKMLLDLARVRHAGDAKVDPLMGSMGLFADEVEQILDRAFSTGDPAHEMVLASMRRARRKARVTAICDDSNGTTGVRMHVPGEAAAAPQGFFDVLHIPVLVTDSQPWVEQDDRTDTPNNRVVAGTDVSPGPSSPTTA
ncbi:hypothetical protein ACFQY4_26710 [Catellatospora bangladeshensis]|uniref:Uncharacterized protein n=1 Tax=Catellatospora bangladeshensis TaxID=310355 RepID=A0A8J3NK24_9ACTN|nr:hypothetical protein [Catellatospora bangladeshensis]GIF82603.1 hypothetical protein Cba03nite_39520 [Catellatospora bangladeshensis]